MYDTSMILMIHPPPSWHYYYFFPYFFSFFFLNICKLFSRASIFMPLTDPVTKTRELRTAFLCAKNLIHSAKALDTDLYLGN